MFDARRRQAYAKHIVRHTVGVRPECPCRFGQSCALGAPCLLAVPQTAVAPDRTTDRESANGGRIRTLAKRFSVMRFHARGVASGALAIVMRRS